MEGFDGNIFILKSKRLDPSKNFFLYNQEHENYIVISTTKTRVGICLRTGNKIFSSVFFLNGQTFIGFCLLLTSFWLSTWRWSNIRCLGGNPTPRGTQLLTRIWYISIQLVVCIQLVVVNIFALWRNQTRNFSDQSKMRWSLSDGSQDRTTGGTIYTSANIHN